VLFVPVSEAETRHHRHAKQGNNGASQGFSPF
jgi:hypothetical protein